MARTIRREPRLTNNLMLRWRFRSGTPTFAVPPIGNDRHAHSQFRLVEQSPSLGAAMPRVPREGEPSPHPMPSLLSSAHSTGIARLDRCGHAHHGDSRGRISDPDRIGN
jgi:hypothetical protein